MRPSPRATAVPACALRLSRWTCRAPGGAPLWSREPPRPIRGAAPLFCSQESDPETAPKSSSPSVRTLLRGDPSIVMAALALLLVCCVPSVGDSAAAFVASPTFIWTVGFFLFVAFQQTREWSKGSEARDEAAKARDEAAKARDEAAGLAAKARDEAAKERDEAAKARDERMLALLSSSFTRAEAFYDAVT